MDTRTGLLSTEEDIDKMSEYRRQFMQKINATEAQVKRGKIGRNELCPCGSGLKFKKCCLIGEP